jgi:hypothetical protein
MNTMLVGALLLPPLGAAVLALFVRRAPQVVSWCNVATMPVSVAACGYRGASTGRRGSSHCGRHDVASRRAVGCARGPGQQRRDARRVARTRTRGGRGDAALPMC